MTGETWRLPMPWIWERPLWATIAWTMTGPCQLSTFPTSLEARCGEQPSQVNHSHSAPAMLKPAARTHK